MPFFSRSLILNKITDKQK